MVRKHYLITGGSAGIGLATARTLAADGHRVYITGRDMGRLQRAADDISGSGGSDVETLLCDSEDLQQIDDLAGSLISRGVRLDGVALNAGIFLPESFTEMTVAASAQTMDVNFRGPLFTLHRLLPCLVNPASIVFVSSLVVHKAFAGAAVYSASKAAFDAAARVLNLELAHRGIRVNAVRPGVTATEIQGKAGMTEGQISDLFEGMASYPLGRVLTAEDMVPAIKYLLSDASIGLRNAHIDIDGGFAL